MSGVQTRRRLLIQLGSREETLEWTHNTILAPYTEEVAITPIDGSNVCRVVETNGWLLRLGVTLMLSTRLIQDREREPTSCTHASNGGNRVRVRQYISLPFACITSMYMWKEMQVFPQEEPKHDLEGTNEGLSL
jgi:hypothetical protein